jgi:hypothetical protein
MAIEGAAAAAGGATSLSGLLTLLEAFCARFAEGCDSAIASSSSFFFDFEKRLTLISLEVGHLLGTRGGVRYAGRLLLGAASTAVHLRSAASSKSLALRPSNLLVVPS